MTIALKGMAMMRSTRTRLGAFGAALVTAILPLAMASPAEATVTRGGCTVSPLRPYFDGTFAPNGKKVVTYPIRVKCDSFRKIQIQQKFLERNIVNGSPKYYEFGSAGYVRDAGIGLDQTIKSKKTLPHRDKDGDDEVLHKVRFRVTSNGVTSAWTPWDFSAVRSIAH